MKKTCDNILYHALEAVAWALMHSYFRISVRGKENIPKAKAFIVASNHTSFLDPLAVQMAIPFSIGWIARKDVFNNRRLKAIHRLAGTIPVNGSIEKAVHALNEEGRVVGIFPEGGRSCDGKMKEADDGVAVLALKSGREVLPVGVKGAFELFPAQASFPKPGRLVVRIGRPISCGHHLSGELDGKVVRENKERIMRGIKELL